MFSHQHFDVILLSLPLSTGLISSFCRKYAFLKGLHFSSFSYYQQTNKSIFQCFLHPVCGTQLRFLLKKITNRSFHFAERPNHFQKTAGHCTFLLAHRLLVMREYVTWWLIDFFFFTQRSVAQRNQQYQADYTCWYG